jgi:N-acetylglucosamine kinase-like BadF-type ATPase
MTNNTSYILTIDTGGSKSKLTLFNSKGVGIADGKCEGMGYAGEKIGGFPFLKEVLGNLLESIPFSSVSTVIINLGGTNTEQLKEELQKFFPSATVRVYRESSGVIMSAFCKIEAVDALLMAGTGTIALAQSENGSVITDGWGVNVGDLGSGYWIGLEAIVRSLKMLEGADELSPLCKHITGLDKPFYAFVDTTEQMIIRDKVRKNFIPLDRARTAALTKVAAEYARKGDAMAAQIFAEAGAHLARCVARGLIAVGLHEAEILVSGGLTNCFDLLESSFEKTLSSFGKKYRYRIGEADMTRGAAFFALNMLKQ